MRLLLVEDDREISRMLEGYLANENFDVVCAMDGEEALRRFDGGFDLVLLDLMIPKIGGMEVLGHIRQKSNVPIIIVSAKDTDADKTLGLGLGADDYITKPFSVTEVLARIRAQIRRNTRYSSPAEEKPETIKAGELTLSLDNYTVTKKGVSLGLTAKEFEILRLLMENPKKVYTKEQIYSKVWNDAYLGDENAVNVHISRLRNKIEDEPGKPKYVVTVWGIGYKFGEIHEGIIILILSIVAAVLAGIICYQQFAFRKGIKAQLLQISQGLARAVDSDSEEKVMVFTNSRAMQELCAQINRLLDRRQRMLADYRRSEISSKKMLSNISHDIRTPLTVILGYLEIIRLNGGEQRELIDKVEARAKAVSDLVEQFFTLAKLEAGDMEIALSKLELCELCREVVLDFYEILSGKDYEVEVEIPEKTVYVQGNGDAIRRILNNLISNSLRYGSEGRYLGIFLHEDEKQVYIDVTDRGRGIEKDFAEHIFDRLFTMEDSRNRDIQGNGLGLTIARSLARQMGGDVTLLSKPWQKTSFTVALKRTF